MPLPPKRGSRSQPVVAQPTRDKGDMPLPPKRGFRSQPVVAQPTRDNGDMRRYRRRAVVEGACSQVTCVTTMSAWMYMDEENFAAAQNFY